jgi:hypothetical protein
MGECEQHLINIVELFLSFLKTDDDAKKSPKIETNQDKDKKPKENKTYQ